MGDGRVPDGTGLSQAEPVARLGPPGFDPSRIAEVVEQVEPSLLAPIIKKAADEFYCAVMETAEDYLRDNLDWNLKSHLAMLERQNQRMRMELSEIDRIIGPPWCTHGERINRLREMDAAVGQLIELRYAVQFDPKRAKAIATETRRAETTKIGSVEDEGAGPKDIAHDS